MSFIVSGIIASIIAFITNRLSFRIWQNSALILPVPLTEEVLKTTCAYLLGANVLYTHLVFGLVEALWDWHGHEDKVNVAVLSILSHGLFGLTTIAAMRMFGNLGAGIAIAFLAHVIWNAWVVCRAIKR